MKYILDAGLEYAFVSMMNKLIFSHQSILKPLLLALRGVNAGDGLLSIQDIDMKLEENKDQQNVLVSLMAKGYLDRVVYKKSNNQLLQEADRLNRQKTSIIRLLENGNQHLGEVNNLLQYTIKAEMLNCFDGNLFNRFVDRITAYSRSEIGFVLKCGLMLKEKLAGKKLYTLR